MLLFSITSIHEFPILSIYVVIAYPQADLDVNVFMQITLVMVVDGKGGEQVIKLNKYLYELKQASANCFDTLKTSLENRGYHQYQVDPSVFYIKDSVILTYVDNWVMVSNKQYALSSLIESLKNISENYVRCIKISLSQHEEKFRWYIQIIVIAPSGENYETCQTYNVRESQGNRDTHWKIISSK